MKTDDPYIVAWQGKHIAQSFVKHVKHGTIWHDL